MQHSCLVTSGQIFRISYNLSFSEINFDCLEPVVVVPNLSIGVAGGFKISIMNTRELDWFPEVEKLLGTVRKRLVSVVFVEKLAPTEVKL